MPIIEKLTTSTYWDHNIQIHPTKLKHDKIEHYIA